MGTVWLAFEATAVVIAGVAAILVRSGGWHGPLGVAVRTLFGLAAVTAVYPVLLPVVGVAAWTAVYVGGVLAVSVFLTVRVAAGRGGGGSCG